ncbi:hypothetical protein DH2020_032825 [Rehmannia glutinosa]|uniref:VQ domain-containing protein n=1 Tax=Rehmannia glutinosa TaxID=99300 RepID=A0ABR0VFQ3_REHGL
MENSVGFQNHSLIPSPNSRSSNSSSSSSAASNGLHHHHPPPPPSPVPITRSEPNNPYPTTFVQADTSSFKQVVQMLTGSTETSRIANPIRNPIPPIKPGPRKDKSGSKLYERRNSLKNFRISPLGPGLVNSTRTGLLTGYSGSPRPGTPEILSPSILDFPSLVLSPVTPLIPDPFNREAAEAEEKAIKEKGFYLHPSPANTPRDSEPRLLPLFPVTSPRAAGSCDS